MLIGSSGQLGQALTKQLVLDGVDFIALDSKQLDITRVDDVNQVVSSIRPEILINAAAFTDVDQAERNLKAAFEVNAMGVENLAVAARNARSIFIHVSTDYVFSGKSNRPYQEGSPIDPQSVYGRSKAAGELVVKEVYSESSYILRTAWLYSEFGKNFAKTMCRLAIESNKEVKVVDDQIGQPSNANDVARQLIKLVNAEAKFGIYHCTNIGHATWFEFAQEIFKHIGADIERVIPVSSGEFSRLAKRPQYSVLDQNAWKDTAIAPMQHWQIALKESMPAILNSIKVQ
jgi:dTDP-4-dehydrorhamnose reductase